ncbi:hypothetical protein ACIGNX_19570 [Actinosynnema sp. NPDC053489]|uniref:hypothetical protein n=1 Tax=Actinosynnema sp. NPDC053489 TaxID=3363916 RepID=UPI0037C5464F
MTHTDPKLVAEIDAIAEGVVETGPTDLDLVDVGGLEPTGGPYKPTTDDPEVERLVRPMGGPYKPTGDPQTNGGPYKPTTDEPVAATQAN